MDDVHELAAKVDEGVMGSICESDRTVDLASCLLVLEVHHHPEPTPTSDGDLSKAYVLVDGLTLSDAWDSMLVFNQAPELIVDLTMIDGYYTTLNTARIRYTDEPSRYLLVMAQHGILESIVEGGFVRSDSWRSYCANRMSERPVDHAGLRSRIATSMGLPVIDDYLLRTEKPLPQPTVDHVVDDSYVLLAGGGTMPEASASTSSSRAASSDPVDFVDRADGGASHPEESDDAVHAGSASEAAPVGSDVVVDALIVQATETASEDAPGGESGSDANVGPLADVSATVDPGAASEPPRGMKVAEPPASGRRTFPATSKVLEGVVPLHGSSGDDVSAVVSALADLRTTVPWMSNVVDVVEEEVLFAWASGSGWKRGHPLLLSGPSGSGKTRFARILAQALGLRFSSMSLAGSTDNRMFEGTSAGWMNAKASWPTLAIASMMSANPMLLIDEVEKVDSTYNGDPRRTLVSMLDPEMNVAYHDVGLDCSVDLSAVSWILCCNEHRQLDVALRDRVRLLEVVGPTAEHLPLVVRQAMVDVAERMGVQVERLPDMGDLMLSRATAVFRTSKSMRAVVRCVDDAVRHRVVADARRGIRLPQAAFPTSDANPERSVDG